MFGSVIFDRLIWRTKELLIWHCTVLSLVQMAQIILSLRALTLCYLAQDVFPMAHTLTIVEPIWPMLQKVSKTMVPIYKYMIHR